MSNHNSNLKQCWKLYLPSFIKVFTLSTKFCSHDFSTVVVLFLFFLKNSIYFLWCFSLSQMFWWPINRQISDSFTSRWHCFIAFHLNRLVLVKSHSQQSTIWKFRIANHQTNYSSMSPIIEIAGSWNFKPTADPPPTWNDLTPFAHHIIDILFVICRI